MRFYDEALNKCLEERKGKNFAIVTCKSIAEALTKTSSLSSSALIKKPLKPLILRSGRLTDV